MMFVTTQVRPLCRVLSMLLLPTLAPLALANEKANEPVFHPLPLAAAGSLAHDADVVDMAAFEPVADVEAYQRRLQQLQAGAAPYAAELAETTLALGLALQQQGRHDEALDALAQSRQILRVNEGLNSLGQARVLQAMIDSSVALQDFVQADALHEALYRLRLQAHGTHDSAVAEASLDWADWNVRRYLQESQGSAAPEAADSRLINLRLDRAYALYTRALAIQQAAAGTPPDALIATERRIAGLTSLVNRGLQDATSHSSLTRLGDNSRQRSRQTPNRFLLKDGTTALQRAISYSLASPTPDLAQAAQRMLELGDWYLLFDERAAAVQAYEDALALLDTAEAAQPDLLQLGSGLPVRDPAASYVATQEAPLEDYDGYIDVEFEVNRFGKASRPAILASTAQAHELEKALLRRIRSSTFRPGFEDGAVLAQHKVQLRYYYSL